MSEDVREKLREAARRAGLSEVPPRTLAAAAAVCVVAVAAAVWHWGPSRGGPESHSLQTIESSSAGSAEPARESTPAPSKAVEASRSALFVHVVGAVRRPGIYQLASGARVAEAVSAAGGLTGNAEERAVNLARQVVDGEQVVVPTKDEAAAGTSAAAPVGGGVVGVGVPSAGAPAASAPVDINTADAAALDALPGIGPSTAAKIVADREANGPFSSPEDLGRVSGIGPKKLETLLGLIVVR